MNSDDKRIYFNELAGRWDSIPGPADAEDRVAAFCGRACPVSAGRVLDVGCGTGRLAPHLFGRLPAETSLVELDYAFDMLLESSRKRAESGLHRVCGDALQPPFPGGSFDVVLCFGILPHLGDARGALKALWRLLRPGGGLAVGHLMGSAQLNARHQSIGGPVAGDTLPPADALEQILHGLGAVAVEAEDVPERYFVRGEKGAR